MAWLNGILLKQCLGWQLLGVPLVLTYHPSPVVLLWNTCVCCNWRQHLQRLSPHGLHWPTIDEGLDTAALTSVSLTLRKRRSCPWVNTLCRRGTHWKTLADPKLISLTTVQVGKKIKDRKKRAFGSASYKHYTQERLFRKVTSVSIHSFVEWLDTFSYVLRPADVTVKEVIHIRCFAIKRKSKTEKRELLDPRVTNITPGKHKQKGLNLCFLTF
jgi:hypothetical protein